MKAAFMISARPPVFRFITSALIGAAIFLSVGGHLAVLQGIAWTTMFQDFARMDSLSTAIEKTFSGKHPCRLCKEITKASSTPQENKDSQIPRVKLSEFIDQRIIIPIMACARPFAHPFRPTHRPNNLSYPPPVPVPIPEQA
jgi:hypothetical protein